MDLSKYEFPIKGFSTDVTKELVAESYSRDLRKGIKFFNELLFSGGKAILKADVKGTWKENAWLYTKLLMKSFMPKHEEKEIVCAMLIEECLELE